ncbi:alpha/beta fold hydrolase [Nocardiopsis alba]|uniref:alpha/beta fold hydrolase n=1 Tax=Nocardiopsis alba TaxID=53437 RepID=UPI0033DBB81B
MKNDVYRVRAAHGLNSAHLVGHSAGGLLSRLIAVEAPERVRSLNVIASSPLGRGEGRVLLRALTGRPQPRGSLPEREFMESLRALMAAPPTRDRPSLINSMIAGQRVLHGTGPPFDEDAARRLQKHVHSRARDRIYPGQRAGDPTGGQMTIFPVVLLVALPPGVFGGSWWGSALTAVLLGVTPALTVHLLRQRGTGLLDAMISRDPAALRSAARTRSPLTRPLETRSHNRPGDSTSCVGELPATVKTPGPSPPRRRRSPT